MIARRRASAPALACFAFAGGTAATSHAASFQGLGALPGWAYSIATAVSDDGTTVVGQSRPTSTSSTYEAFRWTASGMVGLGSLGAPTPRSSAEDVSADGSVVVGYASVSSSAPRQPFRWTQTGGMVVLQDPTGRIVRGQAYGVSSDGDAVAGVGTSSTGNEAFRWTPATGIVGLGSVPGNFPDAFGFGISGDGAVIVGVSGSPAEPFVWRQQAGMMGLGDVPGGIFYAIAWGVSGDGTMAVGGARASSSEDEAFMWRADTGFILPDPLHEMTAGSQANAANVDGSLVVGWTTDSGAMIWDAAHGMRSIQELLENDFGLDLGGWTLDSAQDISADGATIVGSGRNASGNVEAWLVRLPEVASGAEPRSAGSSLALSMCGPNPFAGATCLGLRLPPGARDVRAAIYRIDGRLVRTLRFDATATEAILEWDGTTDFGLGAPAGLYIVRATSGAATASRKILRVD